MVKEYCTGTYVIDNEYAQIWCIEYPYADSLDYCYGGTRTVVPEMEDENVYDRISYLGVYESGLKKDRKSTRLNSSHVTISYAVFCLKKKK